MRKLLVGVIAAVALAVSAAFLGSAQAQTGPSNQCYGAIAAGIAATWPWAHEGQMEFPPPPGALALGSSCSVLRLACRRFGSFNFSSAAHSAFTRRFRGLAPEAPGVSRVASSRSTTAATTATASGPSSSVRDLGGPGERGHAARPQGIQTPRRPRYGAHRTEAERGVTVPKETRLTVPFSRRCC